MLIDHEAPTLIQQRQIAAGQYMAISAAVHAIIATHPNPKAFEAAFDAYAAMTDRAFLIPAAIQADDGMRQSYSEVVRGLREAIPQS